MKKINTQRQWFVVACFTLIVVMAAPVNACKVVVTPSFTYGKNNERGGCWQDASKATETSPLCGGCADDGKGDCPAKVQPCN